MFSTLCRVPLMMFLLTLSLLPGRLYAQVGDDPTLRADLAGPLPPPSDSQSVPGDACPDIVIPGTLGSGSPGYPGTSGTQTGRLNRNAISSTCDSPKPCNILTSSGQRAFDAYTVRNLGVGDTCVGVELNVLTQASCNLQVNAYLGSYDPANICTNYLADPGFSSGIPPSLVSMSFEVPAGANFVLVVHTTNPGEIGCEYELRVQGDLCETEAAPALGRTGMFVAVLALLALGAIGVVRRATA